MSEKLQKVLARAGHGSRREIESIIAAGRVSVDGKIATLGDRVEVTPGLKIRIDGHLISVKESAEQICRVLAYYKPEGELCTRNDPEGRPTVFDRLPKLRDARWIAVGRLDVNTCGLLLFTTDGELANRLMHPSREVEREYAVRVFGQVDDAKLRDLSRGVQLEDGPAAFKTIKFSGGEGINQWYNVTLTEGRNREVRRMFETIGLTVSRLMRVRYGIVSLPRQLKRGKWAEMADADVQALGASIPEDVAEEADEAFGNLLGDDEVRDLEAEDAEAWAKAQTIIAPVYRSSAVFLTQPAPGGRSGRGAAAGRGRRPDGRPAGGVKAGPRSANKSSQGRTAQDRNGQDRAGPDRPAQGKPRKPAGPRPQGGPNGPRPERKGRQGQGRRPAQQTSGADPVVLPEGGEKRAPAPRRRRARKPLVQE